MLSYHSSTLNISDKINVDFTDLRSDTVTLPSKNMLEFACRSQLGDDVYNEDPSVIELQSMAAEMFSKECALFFPSGTQSNLAAILSHCERGDEALIGKEYHTYSHEAHGASVLGGVSLCPIKTDQNGEISIDSAANEIKPNDSHYASTKLLCLENTVSGRVQNQQNIDSLFKFANQSELNVHLDGARIFNAHIHTGLSLSSLTHGADSVSVCLSKGLGCPVGSLLLGNEQFIEKAKRIRKLLGGGMRQAGLLAGCGIYALNNNIERLDSDHKNAKKLADGLSNIEDIDVNYSETQTNMVFIKFNESRQDELQRYLFKHNINTTMTSGQSRLVCHLDISSKQIDQVIERFANFFSL